MGISRSSNHKRRATGGKKGFYRKKRKFEIGRQSANTKLGSSIIREIRVRGGNYKKRAIRIDKGNFAWGSEAMTKRTRIISVVYNATNNELVRTKSVVKSAIVEVDAAPFRLWWESKYGKLLCRKYLDEGEKVPFKEFEESKVKYEKRLKDYKIDPILENQFKNGRILAKIRSRPGQTGRADGYILEGPELEFYYKKIKLKK